MNGSTEDDPSAGAPGPFEGPEKLLEVWFAPSPSQLPSVSSPVASSSRIRPSSGAPTADGASPGQSWLGLRRVPREVWEEMLAIVQCRVMSVIEGEEIDAYLLR
jgi:S-adenosylmethionine decarboxylase